MNWRERLEQLRERPHDERRAIASAVAVVSVVILGGGWSYFFIQGLQAPSQFAGVGAALPDIPAPPDLGQSQPAQQQTVQQTPVVTVGNPQASTSTDQASDPNSSTSH